MSTRNVLIRKAFDANCRSVPELVLRTYAKYQDDPEIAVRRTAEELGVEPLTIRWHLASALLEALNANIVQIDDLLGAL